MGFLDLKVYGDVAVADVLLVLVVMLISAVVAKVVTINIKRALADKIRRDQLELMIKVVYWGIILLALIVVSPILGLNLSGLLVAGGIAGIIVGFASQSVVSNFVSGLFLMIEKPVRLGDQVEIAGISGFVEDIRIMSTIVRTYDGLYVRIPNEKVFTSSITNLSGNVARRFEYRVGISYKDEVERAARVIRNVVEKHPFVLKNPEPQIFVEEFGDNAVILSVRIWSPTSEWFSVRTELLAEIKRALEKEGIEIPFPQRVVWFANELEVKR